MKAPDGRWRGSSGLALALMAVACLVRAANVGLASFRGDEAFSIRLAQLPLSTLFAAVAVSEPNPPLQFLFLRFWTAIAGQSEVAARWPSVLCGVLVVALTYRLGRALIGRRAALLATAWVAVQPFLVWYAQDLRSFSSLAFWCLGAAWCAWEGLHQPTWRWWLASAGAAWLAMNLHYFAALPLGALAVAVGMSPRIRTTWHRAIVAYGIAAAAFLPWAVYVWPLLSGHEKSWLHQLSATEVTWRTLTAYSTGGHWAGAPDGWIGPGAIGLAVLMIVGLIVSRRDRVRLIWLLALGPATPIALGLLNAWRPSYSEHYVITGLIGSLLIAGAGLQTGLERLAGGARSRWFAGVSLAGVAVASLACVWNVWYDPAFVKAADWRGLADALAARAGPNDIVWMNLPDPALEIYLAGRVPLENAPPDALPAQDTGHADTHVAALAAAADQLARVQAGHNRVFLLFSPNPAWDPEGFAGQELDGCCELIDENVVAGQHVRVYDTPRGAMAARQPLDADFDAGMRLTGYRVERVADRLHLTLFWRTDAAIARDYTVFVHLLAADGFQVAGGDGDPRQGTAPTSTWRPNVDVIDPHPIPLPAGLGAGPYHLVIGWYLRETGARVPLDGGGESVALPDVYTFP